ncbi:ABC transporter substrate-binding protein [Oscillospiraceae bacterium HV4-5-C5C]|nr:ABC transporter substrate-binding protein [Oscillospiraceae bacterium HV4-5-C5C]
MKGKQILSSVLAAAMAAGLMTGCSSTAGSSTQASNKTNTEASGDGQTATGASSDSQTDSGELTEITVDRATFNLASSDSAEVSKIQDAINDYIADKIHVKITLNDIPSGEYGDKVNLSLTNNEVNLFWTASWQGTVSTDNLVMQNAAYDISDILQGTDLYDSIPEEAWRASQYNGKDYFIPIYKESAEGYDLVYPTAKAEQYGWDLSTVKELKDLEPMLAQMKADGVKYPLLMQKMPFFSKYYIDKYDFTVGGTMMAVDRSTDEVINTLQTDDYKDFLNLIADWAEKGYISDEEATKTVPDTAIMGTDWGFAAWVDVPINEAATTTYGQDCDVIHMTKNWANSTSTLGSCYAISSSSTEEEAKASLAFLGLLYTDSTLADLYTYGIEGTDYDKDADGFVNQKGDLYNHSAWESGSVKSISIVKGNPADSVSLYEDFNNNSVESSASGFRPDYSSVEAQWSACQSVYDQYGYTLEEGGYAPADVESALAQYQSALDEAGYQDVLKAIQTQYDSWKAAKG